jgi:hypothetical protein
MNDILGLNTLNEKGVNVNVKVELTRATLVELFIVSIGVALVIYGLGFLFKSLAK